MLAFSSRWLTRIHVLAALLALTGLGSAQGSAILSSGEPNYPPGSVAVLTGSGFGPIESVTMLVTPVPGEETTCPGHAPWTVTTDANGGFATTWPTGDACARQMLVATGDGQNSGSHGETNFTENNNCGTGVVTSVTPVGGACVAFTPAVGNGPDNYE